MADYVERVIAGLARALARVAAGRKAGRLAEAQAELAELAMQAAGVDLGMLDAFGAAPVSAGLADPRRREALAAICAERAELEAARGDAAAAARWRGYAAAFGGPG